MQQVPEPKWGMFVVRTTLCKCGGFPTKHFLQDVGLHKQQKKFLCISVSSQCIPSNGFREWTDPKNKAKYALDDALLIGDMGMDVDILETVKHAS